MCEPEYTAAGIHQLFPRLGQQPLTWETLTGTVRKGQLTSKTQPVLVLAIQQGTGTLCMRLGQEENKKLQTQLQRQNIITQVESVLNQNPQFYGLLKPGRLTAQFLNASIWGPVTY